MSLTDYLIVAAKYLVLLGCTAVAGLLAWLYTNQTLLIYPTNFPVGSKSAVNTPDEFNINNWQNVELKSLDDTRLQCFLLMGNNPKHTILFFHANAGNLGHRLPIAKELMNRLDCNVFMLSYRGYGKSDGVPNEKGIILDAQASIDYISNHASLKNTKIVVYGQSLGGAVGIHCTAKNQGKVDALILENTFLSIRKLIPNVFPWLPFISVFCHQKWDSEALIGQIEVPVLFLSGGKDELIPPAHMLGLYEQYSAKQIRTFKSFINGTHNDTVIQPVCND
jgi:pimeloyl-ACP methyl ester carboxylesterase